MPRKEPLTYECNLVEAEARYQRRRDITARMWTMRERLLALCVEEQERRNEAARAEERRQNEMVYEEDNRKRAERYNRQFEEDAREQRRRNIKEIMLAVFLMFLSHFFIDFLWYLIQRAWHAFY